MPLLEEIDPTPDDSPEFRFGKSGPEFLPDSLRAFHDKYEPLLGEDFDNINQLCQIFNRNPNRTYGFIWILMTYYEHEFEEIFSNRDTFKIFLQNHHSKKGSSSKVLACVLQQVFGFEAIPFDTWVKTFLLYPMGFSPANKGNKDISFAEIEEIYSDLSSLDKLEKLIWVSAMANKTNKIEFTDILWCQRYGTREKAKGPCRGANPLSCSRCELTDSCIGFSKISGGQMVVNDTIKWLSNGMLALDAGIKAEAFPQQCGVFGVLTKEGTPRDVYIWEGKEPVLRDEHTGQDFSTMDSIEKSTTTVGEFVANIRK